jgi:hypothetical protein
MPPRILGRWKAFSLAGLAGALLGVAPASALTIGFAASDGNFQPTSAVGTLDLGFSLDELIATDTGGFLVLLGVPVTAQLTLTDSSGPHTTSYALDPRFSTTTEELLLQVELTAGNPAMVQLILSDSAGWRGCIADPATCERRVLTVTTPTGVGVAVGPTFDSDWVGAGYQVDFWVPEPGTGWLLALGVSVLATRKRLGALPLSPT